MTAPQTFTTSTTVTVPADASVARIECWGAQGRNSGGLGGYAKGDLPVTPGQSLLVTVGVTGTAIAAGGGASDVRQGGTSLTDRKIVSGGGGGGQYPYGSVGTSDYPGYGAVGGAGGGQVGLSSYLYGNASGGTQTSGGAADPAGGTPGTFGSGGYGDAQEQTLTIGGYQWTYGGRGGDGWYGGGGAAYPGAGAGGSGYVGGVANATMSTGVQSGDGQVTITWINTAPLAPTLTVPATGASVTVPPTLAWTFSDPDAGDMQTSADIRYRQSGTSTWTTLAAAVTTATTYTFGAGVITTGSTWEWQVRTYDKTGTVGPWSSSSFFTAVDQPLAPTITAPTSGATLLDTPTTVTWTLPAGQSQTAFQVQRCSDATGTVVYYDSGQTTSTAQTTTVPLDRVFGRSDTFRVRYLNGVWSAWGTVAAVTNAGPPQPPLVVCTPDPATASVRVQITNPPQAPGYASAVSNDLWRTSPDGTTVRIAKGLPVGATVTDWLPGAGTNVYRATAYASNGATSTSL